MPETRLNFDNWIEAEAKKNFKLSNPFIFKKSIKLIYKHIALKSLFQDRSIIEVFRDYSLSYSPSDYNANTVLDPWGIELNYSKEFNNKTFKADINGTDKIIECNSCSGAGKDRCYKCGGRKEFKCSSCDGNCQTRCSNCNGRGDVTCNTCYGTSERKHDCYKCGGSGIVSCSYCRNGYNTCSTCAGRGMLQCETCNGNGEITCDKCSGKGKLVEYKILIAKNSVSVESFDILENGLDLNHIEHFDPLSALEERYKLIEINKETINIGDVPQEAFILNTEKIEEIFKEHQNKTSDILTQSDCHRLEMMFTTISIDDFFKIEYDYGGKSYEVIFFKNDNLFYAPENPWEDFRKNLENEIEQLYRMSSKKDTLKQINLYKKENISTVRIEVIKKKILNSFIKKDIFIFALPCILTSIILGLAFNANSDNIPTFFILTLIPFGWIIYKRHKSRKDKIPEAAAQLNVLEYSNSNSPNKKLIIGTCIVIAILVTGLFLHENYKSANTANQENALQENTQTITNSYQDNSIVSNQEQSPENTYPTADTTTKTLVSDTLKQPNEFVSATDNDVYKIDERENSAAKKEEPVDVPVTKKVELSKPNTEPSIIHVSRMEDTKNVKASFPGGENVMQHFLKQNIVFPSNFLQDFATRRFRLNISNDGIITSAKFLQWDSVDPLNNEGLRVISKMPKWIPELSDGRPVTTAIDITIVFSPLR